MFFLCDKTLKSHLPVLGLVSCLLCSVVWPKVQAPWFNAIVEFASDSVFLHESDYSMSQVMEDFGWHKLLKPCWRMLKQFRQARDGGQRQWAWLGVQALRCCDVLNLFSWKILKLVDSLVRRIQFWRILLFNISVWHSPRKCKAWGCGQLWGRWILKNDED